ncbi:MBL fold metallo-hydrolase [uncultured Hymenobacter sp.]|uniref:MBL fold metallo-hydrolase n=1 Tax=uncultured Hymenobacter sp. TaxID=170016 RepID=UPI0035CB0757
MLSNSETRASTADLMDVAPGLHGLRDVFVNLYYAAATTPGLGAGLPTAGAPWVLIDAGLPGSATKIKEHAEKLFGPNNPPQAILLTHGHFDHVGALHGLLEAYPGVFAYAHPLELPYLTGLSAYPPPDPTVGGGMMAYLSFTYPKQPYDFGGRVQALAADGSVPSLPGWRWLHTPGHTFGHVSFLREGDKVLVAGDAFTTVVGESGWATYTQNQVVHGPPAYFTPDWDAARESVQKLAALQPEVAATGHGIAMHGEELRQQLQELAGTFDAVARPKLGRYAKTPATADASGVRSIPAPLVSPVVKGLAVAGTLGAIIALLAGGKKKKKKGKGRTGYSSKSGPSGPRYVARPLASPIARQGHDDEDEYKQDEFGLDAFSRDTFGQGDDDQHAAYQSDHGQNEYGQDTYGQDEPRDRDPRGYEVSEERRAPSRTGDFPRRTAADLMRNDGRPGRPVLLGPIGGGNGEPLVFAHHSKRFD